MKISNRIFTLIFCLITSRGLAQVEKGALLLGGNAGMSYNIEPIGLFNLTLNPNIGIFVSDNLAIGGAFSSSMWLGNGVQAYNFAIVPDVKYYFGLSEKIDLFLKGGLGPSVNINNNGFEPTTFTSFFLYTGPSLVFFLNEHTGIHVGLTYNANFGNEQFGQNQTVNFGGGFQVYLPKSSRGKKPK